MPNARIFFHFSEVCNSSMSHKHPNDECLCRFNDFDRDFQEETEHILFQMIFLSATKEHTRNINVA